MSNLQKQVPPSLRPFGAFLYSLFFVPLVPCSFFLVLFSISSIKPYIPGMPISKLINRLRYNAILKSVLIFLFVWISLCGNKIPETADGYQEKDLDTLLTGHALLIYPGPLRDYFIFLQSIDLKYKSNSYRSKHLNEFGDLNYYQLTVRRDLLKIETDHIVYDYCQPISAENVDILKTEYSSESKFWDFFYKQNVFSSNITINDTTHLSFRTNDTEVLKWYMKNRHDFVAQLSRKHERTN
jgi:hypothetical protein